MVSSHTQPVLKVSRVAFTIIDIDGIGTTKASDTAIDEKKVAHSDSTTQSLSQTQPRTIKGPHFKQNRSFFSRLASQRTLRKKINFISDDDRTILNDALRAKLNTKHIENLLEDYPNACESGGCVDHINHPIHTACEFHHAAVRAILKAAPECAGQRDEKGRLPLENFLTNVDMIDVTTKDSTKIVEALCKLTPVVAIRVIFQKRESIKERVFENMLLPRHLNVYD
jgi:hypothetical protein